MLVSLLGTGDDMVSEPAPDGVPATWLLSSERASAWVSGLELQAATATPKRAKAVNCESESNQRESMGESLHVEVRLPGRAHDERRRPPRAMVTEVVHDPVKLTGEARIGR